MSLDGSSASYLPYTINGLQEISVDASTVTTLQVNSLTPNRVVVADSSNFLISAAASTTEVDFLVGTTSNVQSQLNSKASLTYVDTNFLNKTTSTAQTVQSVTTYLNGLTVSDNRPTNLSSRLEVDANYQSLTTSANVSVGQDFGSISNVGIVYQATSTNTVTPPILILFPITVGERYTLQIEVLGDDAVYDTTLDIYQSQDGVGPFPNFNDAVLDSPLFAPASTVFHQTNATFVATTTGFVVLNLTTSNPSGISTVQWRNLSTFEMGVSLTNATMPAQIADRVVVLNDRKQLVASGISITKLDFLDNVSSDIQTQLNARVLKAGDTMTGTLDMGANKITTTYVPVNGPDLINKTYGDATYATPAALAAYLPLTGGTLTGNFTVSTGNTVSLVDGLTVSTNTRATTASLAGSTINGTHVAATITTLPSPPPVFNITYSGSFSGGLSSSFFPTPGLTYRFTFTKVYRDGLPGDILTVQFLQNVSTITGLVGFSLTSTISITPTSYANAVTITGTFTPPQAGALFLSFFSISGGPASFYWDSFTLTDVTASVSAPLSLTKPITQPINSSAEFAGGLQVAQFNMGFDAAGFVVTGLPVGVNGGTLSGPSGSFYRLTALSGQSDMAMRPNLLSPLAGERYTYIFRGIRGSVPLTLQVIQSTSVNVISTEPITNNITTDLQDITGSFISASNTTVNAFRFSAGSADPFVEWATFSLFRSDTNVRGLLTCGGNTSMLGNATVAGTVGIGTTNPTRAVQIYVAGGGNEYRISSTAMDVGMGINGGNNFGFVYNRQNFPLVFGTNNTDRMRISADGKVGINTTAPDGALDVRDSTGGAVYTPTLQVLGRTDFDGSNIINFQCQASQFGRNILYMTGRFEAGNDAFAFSTPRNGIIFRTQSSLNSAYTDRWTIQNFASSLGFLSASGGNTPRVVFNDNGDVGINTTNPGERLGVQGGIRAFGNAVGGPFPVISENANGGDAYAVMFLRNNNAGSGCFWFLNSTTRAVDGGANTATLRNDAGRLRLQSLGGNGILIYETSGHVEIGHRLTVGGPFSDGIINIRNPNGSYSHFGWVDNGNYLRGAFTQVDTPLNCSNSIAATGKVSAGTTNTIMKMGISGSIAGNPLNGWDDSHCGLLITQDASQNGNSSALALLHGANNVLRSTILSLAPNVAWRPMDIYAAQIDVYYFGTPVAITNGSGWLNISDEREKEDIHDIKTSSSLKRVLALKPKHYRRKYLDEKTPVPDEIKQQRCIGFLAQEVQKSNPHCVGEWENDKVKCDTDDGKRLALSYNDYVVHLVGAVQEQQKQLETYKEQIEVLQAREEIWVKHAKEKEQEFADYRALTDKRLEQIVGLVKGLLEDK
jgi:stress response protein SCP2